MGDGTSSFHGLDSLDRLEADVSKRRLLTQLLDYIATHSSHDLLELEDSSDVPLFIQGYLDGYAVLKSQGLDLACGRDVGSFTRLDWAHHIRFLERHSESLRSGTFPYQERFQHHPLGRLSPQFSPRLSFRHLVKDEVPGFDFGTLSYSGPVARCVHDFLGIDLPRVTSADPRGFIALLRNKLVPVLQRSIHHFASTRSDQLLERLVAIRQAASGVTEVDSVRTAMLADHASLVRATHHAYDELVRLTEELADSLFPIPGYLDSSDEKAAVPAQMQRLVELLHSIDAQGLRISVGDLQS